MKALPLFLVAFAFYFVGEASDNLDYGAIAADCVVDREGYALGYSEAHEQPVWVMYRLTREEVLANNAKRDNWFKADTNIITGSALPVDYAHSGYDRGHLAPAEDMEFSPTAMAESFYMSNVSPQKPEFNRGIWKRLENAVRRRAVSKGSVFVITGPIFASDSETIGKVNRVSVPNAFYKIIYDETPPMNIMAYIMPNEGSDKPIENFACDVAEIEQLTGLVFPKMAKCDFVADATD